MANYSLWLRPSQIQIDEFTKIISDLAQRYGTAPFPPHITLLSSITAELDTIKQVCKKIVAQTQEFDIRLKNIGYAEAYFRNFFILAASCPALLNIYKNAKKEFAYKTDEEFMPHLSLLYGNINLHTKRKLKEKLGDTYQKIFNCQRLDLYHTGGKIYDWYLIESYTLTKTKK